MRKISFKILFDVFYNKELLNVAINKYFENIDISNSDVLNSKNKKENIKNNNLSGSKLDNRISLKTSEGLNKTFNSSILKNEDKAFIKREVTGVIEKLDEIDDIISKYSKVKTSKLNKDVLLALRIGVYEITYMDRVPAYATINECVNLIKYSKNSKLSSYVNGVLRNYLRENEKSIEIKKANELSKNDLKRNYYFRIYNNNEKQVIDELDEKKVVYEKYTGDLEFRYAKVYRINKYKDIIDTASFRNGNVLIEDASSVYLTDILAYLLKNEIKTETCLNKKIEILDTCSAPGGKVLGLLDLIRDDFSYINIIARDVSNEKIEKIGQNIDRLKLLDSPYDETPNNENHSKILIDTQLIDASIYDDKDKEKYDLVVCDVPCTGLGVIEKKPDIIKNYSDEKRDLLVSLQKKILDVSKQYVKKGGFLSYSTCTETNEENCDNINSFIEKNINYKKIFEKQIFHNDENKCDGFYICILKRIT